MQPMTEPLASTDGFRPATYVVAGAGLVAAAGAAGIEPRLALVPLAVLLGWSHLSSV
jgi:hypothetical protein